MSTHTLDEMKALQKQLLPWFRELGCHGIFLAERAPGEWAFHLYIAKLTEEIERKVAERLPGIAIEYREVPPPRAL